MWGGKKVSYKDPNGISLPIFFLIYFSPSPWKSTLSDWIGCLGFNQFGSIPGNLKCNNCWFGRTNIQFPCFSRGFKEGGSISWLVWNLNLYDVSVGCNELTTDFWSFAEIVITTRKIAESGEFILGWIFTLLWLQLRGIIPLHWSVKWKMNNKALNCILTYVS